jgi:iron complex outermembrane receptor protein/vitamin B12 transporter
MHQTSLSFQAFLLSFRSAAKESAVALALTFAFINPALHGQTTLHGRVLDPLGAAVPNADIVLHAANPFNGPNEARGAKSAADGTYTIAVPAHCPCTFFITAPSFATTVVPLPQNVTALDLTLATPTRTDAITVTATGTPTPLAQSGAPISVLASTSDYPYVLAIDQPLRFVPGVQITTAGQLGAVTTIFTRGGNSDFTKVLVDGVPVNDIGSLADLSTLTGDGLSQIEILRQPSSVLYGSDVVAAVVSLSTQRGLTPLPLFSYAIDGGNLGTVHQTASIGGARAKADYFTGVGVLQTANNQVADQFHSTSFFGNYGFDPDPKDDLRLTFRHTHTNSGNPNAILLYGVPDLINQFYAETFLSLTGQQQTTPRWHNLFRYGWQALNYGRVQYASDGTYSSSAFAYLGKPVTLHGANGYSTSGQGIIDYSAHSASLSTTRRDFAYGQSDYRVSHYLTALGAFQFDSEKGASQYSTAARRNFSGTLQLSGDAFTRLFYVVGTGIEANDLYGKALTPRASLAYYALRPDSSKFLSGTKLHASFGKGVEEPSVGDQIYSLANTLTPAQDTQYNVIPLRGQFSRTYDAGVEQLIGDGRARLNLSYFHNQFTNVIEYVPDSGLKQLGVPAGVYTAPGIYGAYVNSLAYRAEGAELESEVRILKSLFARFGYTYLDARVQHSFSSDALGPSFNTTSNFSTVPIGNYSPLIGARPFRRAPHSGYFALQYTHARFDAQFSGTLVGRRDDSTFLGGSDANYGNSLLLPNRNLDPSYQNLALTADYRIASHLTTYATLNNLLNQSYQEAFGYPALPIAIRGGLKLTFGGETFHLK